MQFSHSINTSLTSCGKTYPCVGGNISLADAKRIHGVLAAAVTRIRRYNWFATADRRTAMPTGRMMWQYGHDWVIGEMARSDIGVGAALDLAMPGMSQYAYTTARPFIRRDKTTEYGVVPSDYAYSTTPGDDIGLLDRANVWSDVTGDEAVETPTPVVGRREIGEALAASGVFSERDVKFLVALAFGARVTSAADMVGMPRSTAQSKVWRWRKRAGMRDVLMSALVALCWLLSSRR